MAILEFHLSRLPQAFELTIMGSKILEPTNEITMNATTSRNGLGDRVYEHVKQELFESKYLPGEWLPVEKIAADLLVSRQPVIDSMRRLATEGFVIVVPQVGCQVRTYEEKEIQDFYRLFAFGEALVCEMATQRANSEDLIKLTVVSQQIGQLNKQKVDQKELARLYRSLNRIFHSEIRRIARSPSVTEVVERMGDKSDFFIATSGRPMFAETLKQAHQEHVIVLKAMQKRDSAGASAAIFKHIQATHTRLQEFLKPS